MGFSKRTGDFQLIRLVSPLSGSWSKSQLHFPYVEQNSCGGQTRALFDIGSLEIDNVFKRYTIQNSVVLCHLMETLSCFLYKISGGKKHKKQNKKRLFETKSFCLVVFLDFENIKAASFVLLIFFLESDEHMI